VQTFGLASEAEWRALDIRTGSGTTFRVDRKGERLGDFTMSLLGDHNVRNALAAIAVGVDLGLDLEQLRKGLAAFTGVKRRLEIVGEARGVTIYDDFAHHPTAVDETLRALKSRHPSGRLWAVFEARSATACRNLHQHEYESAFRVADRVIFAPLGRTNIPDAERLDVARIARAIGEGAETAASVDAIVERLTGDAQPGDVIALLSNGAFGGIHARLLRELGG
jgi:UDP-N-acetylmuramate: L-alanyl-gamma-D-glutamyl-meso-diaminopimelate ligase